MARPKGSPKYGGRKKGTPNKTTALLKDAILRAAELAGKDFERVEAEAAGKRPTGKNGLEHYLRQQAKDNPGPFLALLGKVLPMQVTGPDDGPVKVTLNDFYAPLAPHVAAQAQADDDQSEAVH